MVLAFNEDFKPEAAKGGAKPAPGSPAPGPASGPSPSALPDPSDKSLESLSFGKKAQQILASETTKKVLHRLNALENIQLAAGTNVFFKGVDANGNLDNSKLRVSRDGQSILGAITIRTHGMANIKQPDFDKNIYNDSVTFKIGKTYYDPETKTTKTFTLKEQLKIIQNLVNKLGTATQNLEDKKLKPFRSNQKMVQTIMPDLANLQGLALLCQKPEFWKGTDDLFKRKVKAKIRACNRELEESGDKYRVRVNQERAPKVADDSFTQRFLKKLIPSFLHERLHLISYDQDKYLDPPRNRKQFEREPPKNKKCDETDLYGRLIKRDENGVPIVNWAGRTEYWVADKSDKRHKDVQLMYNSVHKAAGILSGFQDYHIQKYIPKDPKNNIIDREGIEWKKTGPDEYKKVRSDEPGAWESIKTFFSAEARAGQATDLRLEKDDDLCRLQVFLGKQISDFKYMWRYIRDMSFWNRKENRSFVELALGEHYQDSMTQTTYEYLKLADSFAFDHRTAKPGKRLWSTSGFVQQLIQTCDPKRAEQQQYQGRTYIRPKSLGILNIHFSKLWDVKWLRGNFGCHWLGSDIGCGDSVIIGNFDQATFTNCKLGNNFWYGLKSLGRVLLGGRRSPKAAFGFSGGFEPDGSPSMATGVTFENSSVGAHTAFYGGIKDGDFRTNFWSTSHFAADCSEMDSFGIKPNLPFKSFRFAFSNFNPLKQTDLDEMLKASLIPDWNYWHRLWIHNAAEMREIILSENKKARALEEKMFYMHTAEWVPNSIRGAGFRFCVAASTTIANQNNLNNANIETMFYNSSVRNPWANCGKAAGYLRLVDDTLNVPKWERTFNNISAVGLWLKAVPYMACPSTVDMFAPKG
jgi:hypothetical protein